MHLNNDPLENPAPTKKACIRDMHELVTNHLPSAVVKLTSLKELVRRGNEIMAEEPRFKEEVPMVIAYERRRRAQHKGLLLAGSRTRAIETASQVYFHG